MSWLLFYGPGETVYICVSRYNEDIDGHDVAHLAGWFDAVCGDGCSSDFDLNSYVDAKDLLLQGGNFGTTP